MSKDVEVVIGFHVRFALKVKRAFAIYSRMLSCVCSQVSDMSLLHRHLAE